MKDLGNIILRGAVIMLAREGVSKLLGVIGTMIVARIFFPEDFGAIAAMYALINFPSMLIHRGISVPLIQQRESDGGLPIIPLCVSAVCGAVTALFFWYGAEMISRFMGVFVLEQMLKVAAPALLLRALAVVPASLLQKRLQFFRAALPRLMMECVFWCIAIVLSCRGWGAVSYAWASLGGAAVYFLTCWWLVVSNNQMACQDAGGGMDALRCGLPAVLVEVIEYVAMNMDGIIIVKCLGPVALGFYFLAFKFSNYFYLIIGSSLSNVFFPAFSIIDDSRVLKGYFLRTTLYLAAIIFPFYLLAMFFSHELIRFLYGVRWMPAAPLLSILCVAGLMKGLFLGGINRDIFYAGKKLEEYLRLKGLFVVLNAAGIVSGLFVGVKGVAIGVTIACFFCSILLLARVLEMMGVSWRDYGVNLKAPIIAGTVMMLLLVLLQSLFPVRGLSVSGFIMVGIAVYIGMLSQLGVCIWDDVRLALKVCFVSGKIMPSKETFRI